MRDVSLSAMGKSIFFLSWERGYRFQTFNFELHFIHYIYVSVHIDVFQSWPSISNEFSKVENIQSNFLHLASVIFNQVLLLHNNMFNKKIQIYRLLCYRVNFVRATIYRTTLKISPKMVIIMAYLRKTFSVVHLKWKERGGKANKLNETLGCQIIFC